MLWHPLPLAAVGLLALNDHLLKGSGVLPGRLTGKLSDFAGLFFFPMLLFCVAWSSKRLFFRHSTRASERLAMACAFLTGAVFAAVKLYPPANALTARVWGRMWMDPSDLWALSVLPLSLVFMLRRLHAMDEHTHAEPASSHLRAAQNFAAVFLAGLASAATSPAPPPPVPPPPPPPQTIAASSPAQVAESPAACASLTLSVCERSSSMSFVVVEVIGQGPGSCTVRVAQAADIGFAGSITDADKLPDLITVKEGEKATFSLSFIRHIVADEITANARVRLGVRRARDVLESGEEEVELSRACSSR